MVITNKMFHYCRTWSNSNIGTSSIRCTQVFILSNIKMSVCFANINSIAATTLKFINYVRKNINRFFNVKDATPVDILSNIIYKFQCSSCNAIYVGYL